MSEQNSNKNFLQWQTVRKTNPNFYYSAKAQHQIVADRQTLGDAFYDKGQNNEN